MRRINVAIVGCGLIGRKRAEALRKFENCLLKVVADVNMKNAKSLADEFDCESETDWKRVVERDDVDVVVIATYNKHLLPISVAALENKKHILCEKPLGRNLDESKQIVEMAEKNSVIVKTGFNHRHHPAIARAREVVERGEIGDICFLRCRYGHGGRPGYDKEWRADKDICGGGEMLDQGVHVVDLFRWFAGEFDEAFAYLPTYFWDMQVEDNAIAIFKKKSGVVATMHTSWTQWKNIFSLEVFGKKGYVTIEGLGGSYGVETLKVGRRRPEGGAPKEEKIEFTGPDISWENEWKEFLSAIESGRKPMGNGFDGYQANKMIDAVYRSSDERKIVNLESYDG